MHYVIVDCAVYRGGQRVPGTGTPEEAWIHRQENPDSFIWLGLSDPTEDEFNAVTTTFDLHELAVEDALEAHQRPKLEVYDDTLLMVLKPARYLDREEAVELGEILMLVGPGFLITVRHQASSALADVRHRTEDDPDMLQLGPYAALHAIVDRIVDDYFPVLDGLENDIREVETEVFSDSRVYTAERIYRLKRQVIQFQLATAPLLEPLNRLSRRRVGSVPEELSEYFRDVHDHLLRVLEQVANNRELLTSVLEANLTQVSVRQNEDMRRISAVVAIVAVPTMIAGIYGMNFDNMPELHWAFGYFFALGAMVLICAVLWVVFRRTGWL